jgi:hypothetical protein
MKAGACRLRRRIVLLAMHSLHARPPGDRLARTELIRHRMPEARTAGVESPRVIRPRSLPRSRRSRPRGLHAGHCSAHGPTVATSENLAGGRPVSIALPPGLRVRHDRQRSQCAIHSSPRTRTALRPTRKAARSLHAGGANGARTQARATTPLSTPGSRAPSRSATARRKDPVSTPRGQVLMGVSIARAPRIAHETATSSSGVLRRSEGRDGQHQISGQQGAKRASRATLRQGERRSALTFERRAAMALREHRTSATAYARRPGCLATPTGAVGRAGLD